MTWLIRAKCRNEKISRARRRLKALLLGIRDFFSRTNTACPILKRVLHLSSYSTRLRSPSQSSRHPNPRLPRGATYVLSPTHSISDPRPRYVNSRVQPMTRPIIPQMLSVRLSGLVVRCIIERSRPSNPKEHRAFGGSTTSQALDVVRQKCCHATSCSG